MYAGEPTWHLYPPDVPIDQRVGCTESGCSRRGQVIEVHSSLLGSAITGNSATTTAWCLEHAMAHGYTQPAAPASVPPAHLNAFQRLLVQLLHRGGEGPVR